MRKHAQCYFNIYCLCSYKPTVASTWAHWRWKVTIFSKFSKPFLNILWSGTWKIDISVLWKRFWEHWIEVPKGQCACLSERERRFRKTGILDFWNTGTQNTRKLCKFKKPSRNLPSKTFEKPSGKFQPLYSQGCFPFWYRARVKVQQK